LDDVIIGRDGENVSPEELENLFNISDLYTCAILGIKQRSGSHQINLLIHFQNNVDEETRTKLISKINQIVESIPLYKRPIKFYAVNFLPLTNLGKVKHKELIDAYQKHKLELVPLTKNTESNLNLIKDEKTKALLLEVRKCFAKIFNKDINDIYDNTNFVTDLGGSSIDYYGLLNEVSLVTKKEIKLSENNILLTPLDFVAYIIKN
jgi:acyl carrier protein